MPKPWGERNSNPNMHSVLFIVCYSGFLPIPPWSMAVLETTLYVLSYPDVTH